MILTNKKSYPKIVVNALTNVNAKYSKGEEADISVTQLISAPLVRILKEKHYDEIVEDVDDRMYSFFGSLAHEFLENVDCESVILKEQRLFLEVGEWILSGQFDLVYKCPKRGNVLADFKFTSKYAVKDGAKPEWTKQLNIYKYMLENTTKDKIDALEVIAPIRDATFLDDKLVVLPVKMFKSNKVREYIESRVALHKLCQDEIVAKIPECTPQERWQDPTKWAVCAKPGTRSLKNHDSRAKAEAHAKHIGGVVEIRPQENKKCSRFCNVNKWCWWWQDYKEGWITDSHNLKDGEVPERKKFK